MTYTFPELLHVDGTAYHLFSYPLEAYLVNFPAWPRFPKRPWNTNGYMATWAVEHGFLCLTELNAPSDDPMASLFPLARAPVPAFWLHRTLRAVHGDSRHVGYPSRRIFDDEIYLEVNAGVVTRQWVLDLRGCRVFCGLRACGKTPTGKLDRQRIKFGSRSSTQPNRINPGSLMILPPYAKVRMQNHTWSIKCQQQLCHQKVRLRSRSPCVQR
jgi:hypothetical protein